MKKELVKEFNKLKNDNIDFVILEGKKNILISCPHAVNQTRNGNLKYSEPETALLGILANKLGYPCFIKTTNENNDANFDIECNYKKALLDFCRNNNIELVIDLHQLRKDREMDICLGTGDCNNTNLGNKSHLIKPFLENFSRENYIVTINNPFSASKTHTVAGFLSSKNISSIQIEINSKNVNDDNEKNFSIFSKTFLTLLDNLEKEINIYENISSN